jgi:hypothetical protein
MHTLADKVLEYFLMRQINELIHDNGQAHVRNRKLAMAF